MRNKVKLAFDELEKELTIITQAELMQLMGGNGSGLSADASVEEVASYLHDIGVPLTQDSSGNYYFNSSGNSIMIEEVVVMGYSTGMSSSGDGQSGYSSGINGEMTSTDIVVAYLQSYGYSFAYNNGNYTYHSNNNNDDSTSNGDPWERDSNEKIIATRTQAQPFDYSTYGVNMSMEEYTITTKDNKSMKVYKVSSVIDPVTGLPRSATSSESANCLGYALTGSTDFWVLDNPNTTGVNNDEGKITNDFMINTLGYSVTTNKSEANLVMVYSGGEAYHAGIVNSNGTYDAKGGTSPLVMGMTSEAQFLQPYGPNGPSYAGGTVVYYK